MIREMPKDFRNLLPLCPSEAETKQIASVFGSSTCSGCLLAWSVAASFPPLRASAGKQGAPSLFVPGLQPFPFVQDVRVLPFPV